MKERDQWLLLALLLLLLWRRGESVDVVIGPPNWYGN